MKKRIIFKIIFLVILFILSLVLANIVKNDEVPKVITCILGLVMAICFFLIPFTIAWLISDKNASTTFDKKSFDEKTEYKRYREYKKQMMKGIISNGEFENWKNGIISRNKKFLSDKRQLVELNILMEYKARNYRNTFNCLMGLCIPMIVATLTMLVSLDKSLELDWTYAYYMISIYTISVTAIFAKGLDYMKQQENFMNDCINALFPIDNVMPKDKR